MRVYIQLVVDVFYMLVCDVLMLRIYICEHGCPAHVCAFAVWVTYDVCYVMATVRITECYFLFPAIYRMFAIDALCYKYEINVYLEIQLSKLNLRYALRFREKL